MRFVFVSILEMSTTPILPDDLCKLCDNQEWGLEIRHNLPEGRGVFTQTHISKVQNVCNYGGKLMSGKVGKALQDTQTVEQKTFLFEFNFDRVTYFVDGRAESPSVGALLNHSKKHPNLIPKVHQTKNGEPQVIFKATRDILPGEELTWDYGCHYIGVNDCVTSCQRCGEPCYIMLHRGD